MLKQGRFILIALMVAFLSGCLSNIWTASSLVYDRHNVFKKLSDYQLQLRTTNALYSDKLFKNEHCVIDIAVLNGDVLIAGHLPSQELLQEANKRLTQVSGYRRLFNRLTVRMAKSNSIEDAWITTKIRSQIFADDTIDPNAFKVVTSDRIVYLMGDVRKEQAEKVINIARFTSGVEWVVKMLKYFTYEVKSVA